MKMKKLLASLVLMVLVLSVMPSVLATSVGTGVGVDINTEEFAPRVWMCDHRIVSDDGVQWGRVSQDEQEMMERSNNYAFEGEQIGWKVLVMDKNKIDQNIDVYATIGDSQGEGNDIEVNCERLGWEPEHIPDSCNARIQEEYLTDFNDDTMSFFWCTFTVETPESMYGEYWVTVEAQDGEGLMGTMDENEYWYLNPEIALDIQGDLTFEDVRPGTDSYSDTLLVGNDADEGSGVKLDMFISGTDFYDSSSSGARCPDTNQLSLDAFRYFATNGAYSTATDAENDLALEGIYDVSTVRDRDVEGYVNIQRGDHWDRSMYYEAEIMQAGFEAEPPGSGGPVGYYRGNILTPGAEMALTFKLSLPEPCVGDFDSGSIYFWGEAI